MSCALGQRERSMRRVGKERPTASMVLWFKRLTGVDTLELVAPISEPIVLIGRGRWITEIRASKALAVPHSFGFAVFDDAARLHRRVLGTVSRP